MLHIHILAPPMTGEKLFYLIIYIYIYIYIYICIYHCFKQGFFKIVEYREIITTLKKKLKLQHLKAMIGGHISFCSSPACSITDIRYAAAAVTANQSDQHLFIYLAGHIDNLSLPCIYLVTYGTPILLIDFPFAEQLKRIMEMNKCISNTFDIIDELKNSNEFLQVRVLYLFSSHP